jgi:hypothetical protein
MLGDAIGGVPRKTGKMTLMPVPVRDAKKIR